MKIVLNILVLFYFMSDSFSQTGKVLSVRGNVTDSLSALPIPYVTISVKSKTGPIELKVLADKEGVFVVKNLLPGRYEITAIVSGYKTAAIDAGLTDTLLNTFDLGNIVLAPLPKQLKNVTVLAKKPLITQEIDRLSYSIQDDPESKTSNLMDMMRKIPFLSVNAEDILLFKGQSNFKILLDGRSSSLFNNKTLRDVLKGMPASNILQIEVITVPPARYESEGLAGIINIITNRKLKDGHNGSFNTNYSRLYSGLSSTINVKKGKLGFNAFGGNSWEQLPRSPYDLTYDQFSPVRFRLLQNGTRHYTSNNQYLNVFSSYEIDSLHLLTLSAGLNNGFNKNTRDQFSLLTDENNNTVQSYQLLNIAKNKDFNWDAGLNLQKNFKGNKSKLFTFSYKYQSYIGELSNNTQTLAKINYTIDDSRQRNESTLREHTAQADYVHPIKSLTIEAGTKLINRLTAGDFTHTDIDPLSGESTTDLSLSDIFTYEQTILGIYNSYTLRKQKFSARTGLRFEATMISGDFKQTNTVISQNYKNLIPSVSFLFRLKNTSTITLGYTQRIQRPGIHLLNPFTDQSDPRFLRSGNPFLQPVRNHSVVSNYSRIKKNTVNLGFTYTYARNTIQSIASPANTDSVVHITYRNIGKYDNAGLNINLNFPLSKTMTLSANGTISYVWTKGMIDNQPEQNQGMEGFAYAYLSYKAKNNWRFSLNGGYYGPVRNLQGNSNSYFYSSAGVSKQLFKQKASLSLTASNPFQRFRTLKTTTNSDIFLQQSISKNYFRNINVSFYYRFGKLSEEIKRNRRSINNDDKAAETGKAQ